MASCAHCNSTILFGGTSVGTQRFCNDTCAAYSQVITRAAQIPESQVLQAAYRAYGGPCPKCQGTGPIDVFTSHTIWSALYITSWKSQPQMSCRACAVKSQSLALVSSLVLGWWGFPWGLIMTPVQVIRNIRGLFKSPSSTGPSSDLLSAVRLDLAS